MDFIYIYLFIPILLFLLQTKSNNYLLVLYLCFVFIFSYDNVTDYYLFYGQFKEVVSYGHYIGDTTKGLEIAWLYIYKLFSFTKYGYVIIHLLVNAITIFFFLFFSQKQNLLNISIIFFFILDIISVQDNVMRQNPAILFGMYGFYLIITENKIRGSNLFKLFLVTLFASLFHFSALFLLPLLFCFVFFLKTTEFDLRIVIPLAIFIAIVKISGIFGNVLNMMSTILSIFDNDYFLYYAYGMGDMELTKGGLKSGILILCSIVPLLYFYHFNRLKYKSNVWLRLSVNLTFVIMCWNYFFMIPVLTRFMSYLLWFQVWGWGYMVADALYYKRKYPAKLFFLIMICSILFFYQYRRIVDYYGTNNYMTIFTDDCKSLKTYPRLSHEHGEKRIRIRQ